MRRVAPNLLRAALLSGCALIIEASVLGSLTAAENSTERMSEDGATRAAACAVQHPDLLIGYAKRPGWHVAGVDYCVGFSGDAKLKDPERVVIRGVAVDRERHLIRVGASDTTLDGYDFSLHGGYSVVISGASRVRILNSIFVVGPDQTTIPIQAESDTSELIVDHNVIDGGGIEGGATRNPSDIWTLVQVQGEGATIEHNWLRNAPQHIVEISHGPLKFRFNLVEGVGFYRGAHPNGTQFNGGEHAGSRIAFNTFYAPQPAREFPLGLGEAVQVEAQLGSTIRDTEVDHNTIVTTGPHRTASYTIAFHQDASGGPNINDGGSVHDNYLDVIGAYGPFYPKSGGAAHVSYAHNVDMRSGLEFPALP